MVPSCPLCIRIKSHVRPWSSVWPQYRLERPSDKMELHMFCLCFIFVLCFYHTCIVQLSNSKSVFFVSSISNENELRFLTVCFTWFFSVHCLCSLFIFDLECLTALLVTFWQRFPCFQSVTEYVSICLTWINSHLTTHSISVTGTIVSSSINDTPLSHNVNSSPFFQQWRQNAFYFTHLFSSVSPTPPQKLLPPLQKIIYIYMYKIDTSFV